jgi:hypothetical protein
MKLDRRLMGVLIISLIVGSLISLYLIRERIESPISVIDQSFPARALAGTSELDRDKYSVAFVSREDLKEVDIRFACLMQVQPRFTEDSPEVSKPEKAGEMIEQVNSKIEIMRSAGYEPDVVVQEIEIEGHKHTLVIYDFGSKLNQILPAEGSSYFPTVYAVAVNKSKRIDVLFEGVTDFFFMREISLKELEVTRNVNKTTYVAVEGEEVLQPGALPASHAPERARVVFTDLHRNDRVSIVYRIASNWGGYPLLFQKQLKGRYMLHLVEFEIDGELAWDNVLVHLMENGAYKGS